MRQDYLSGAETLRPFYQYPLKPADYLAIVVERQKFPTDRGLLVEELLRQNADLADNKASLENIRALGQPHTFTVTTGHQLCLLGGPMYTVYKIATAIKLAQRIQQQVPGVHIVPVFWMATEDHDWEEVNHYYADANQKQTYAAEHQGPVGRHVITEAIHAAWTEEVPEELRAFFAPGETMAHAFRGFVHHLFGQYGLVIVDGDSRALKASFLKHMAAELEGRGIAGQVKASTQRLVEVGYTPPVKPRDINLFYMGHGQRRGIQAVEGRVSIPDAGLDWSVEEALTELELKPDDFSPNVALRPLYQEFLLPNLAYVGGWAEMAYWMQLKGGFEQAEIPFPLLVPRMSATLYTAEQAQMLQELGLEAAELAAPLHVLQERYLSAQWDSSPLEAHGQTILEAYSALAGYLDGIDPTLGTSLRGERGRVEGQLDNLIKKVRKALRNKNPKPYAALAALKGRVWPEQDLQERLLNLTAFPIPPKELVSCVMDHCEPEVFEAQWIQLP